jgi:hypothetical protein
VFTQTLFLIRNRSALLVIGPHVRQELNNRDGFAVVLLFWTLMPLLGAVPFMLSERPHIHLRTRCSRQPRALPPPGPRSYQADLLPCHRLLPRTAQFPGRDGHRRARGRAPPHAGIGGMQLYMAETPGLIKEKKLTRRGHRAIALGRLCGPEHRLYAFVLARGDEPLRCGVSQAATLALGGFRPTMRA